MEFSLELIAGAVISGLLMGGIYVLLSIGLSLLLGVLGVINLGHGEFMMLAMYNAFWLYSLAGVDPFISMIVSIPALFFIGVMIQKYLVSLLKTPENIVLVTYALGVVLANTVLALWSSEHRAILSPYTRMSVSLLVMSTSLLRILAFVVSLGIAFLLYVFVSRTRSGKTIICVAQDRTAAELMGIDSSRVHLTTFGIAIALTAVPGTFLAQIVYAFPTIGSHFTIMSLVVVVLAGSGNIHGAILGGLLIGVVESLSGVLLGIGYKEMIIFVIFILVLLFKPEGLFGKLGRRA